MASIAGWWAIPAVAFVAVVLWTAWRGRAPKPLGMRDSVAQYEHFQAVLTRVVGGDATETPAAKSPDASAATRNGFRRADTVWKHGRNGRPGGATDWAADRLAFPEEPDAAEPRAAAQGDVP
ncbi:MAG TPA: hypothetical protein VLH10_24950 [Yinghuangia sp.]|uniref:hypothetical protein n=1 Tax=Yinghuangia sp. YIM S10712 TaxID=3436930 RepID=UPI002B9AC79C|nr:hypothetical protein [Yinghuangia sp.]